MGRKISGTISSSKTLLSMFKKKLEKAKALDLAGHFTSGEYFSQKAKKSTRNIEMRIKKFFPRHTDCFH